MAVPVFFISDIEIMDFAKIRKREFTGEMQRKKRKGQEKTIIIRVFDRKSSVYTFKML